MNSKHIFHSKVQSLQEILAKVTKSLHIQIFKSKVLLKGKTRFYYLIVELSTKKEYQRDDLTCTKNPDKLLNHYQDLELMQTNHRIKYLTCMTSVSKYTKRRKLIQRKKNEEN